MEFDIEAIIKQCKKGNLEKFAILFDAFHEKIYAFVYFRTHHRETAEDLTSRIFIKALENIHGFNLDKGSFNTWIYQIARNSVIDHYRTHKENLNIDDAFDIKSPTSVERDVDTAQKLEKVQKYLGGLPTQQRDIVVMRVWDGLSHKEISEVLGISEASSKTTFSRVITKLNQEVGAIILLLTIAKELYGKIN